jgi:hypothetical protein
MDNRNIGSGEGRLSTEHEIIVFLDAHDSLVNACVEGSLSFAEFLAAYGGFPHNYALDGKGEKLAEGDALRFFRKRIAFHSRVASILAALNSTGDPDAFDDTGQFAPKVGLMRLRALIHRYPDLEAEPETIRSGAAVSARA